MFFYRSYILGSVWTANAEQVFGRPVTAFYAPCWRSRWFGGVVKGCMAICTCLSLHKTYWFRTLHKPLRSTRSGPAQSEPSKKYSSLHPILIKPTGFLSSCLCILYAVMAICA